MTVPQQDADRDVDQQLAKIGAEFGEACPLPAIIPDKEDLQSVKKEKAYLGLADLLICPAKLVKSCYSLDVGRTVSC